MHKIPIFLIIKKILIEMVLFQEILIKILEYNKVNIDKIYKLIKTLNPRMLKNIKMR
jgi:hypothetical protein